MSSHQLSLRFESVGISYPVADSEPVTAVDGVSFGVEAGEFVSVVGPSGCGKTSLLNAAAGLRTVSAGRVMLGAAPITGPHPEVVVVFQQASLLPWRTVLGNVCYGLELRKDHSRAQLRAHAREQLAMVGLDNVEGRYPHQLSGGMQQRVNLARALALDPSLLLMDEPFAALDAQTRDHMQAELLRIWSDTGASVLFITHQVDEAIYLSDRVVVMSGGPRARIIDIVDVPFERPRDARLKRSAAGNALFDRITTALSDKRTLSDKQQGGLQRC